MTLKNKLYKNIVGNGENAANKHFLLFPQCFLTFPNTFNFVSHTYVVVCKWFHFLPVYNYVVGRELIVWKRVKNCIDSKPDNKTLDPHKLKAYRDNKIALVSNNEILV